jgi:hypothetical protein
MVRELQSPQKIQQFRPYLFETPPIAKLLNGISRRYKTVQAQNIVPVIHPKNGLKFGHWNKAVQVIRHNTPSYSQNKPGREVSVMMGFRNLVKLKEDFESFRMNIFGR